METVYSISDVRQKISAARLSGKKIAFVPTMGALHSGHMSLVKKAHEHADFTVMSIFVNPIQFNDKNDYINYPKTLDSDLQKAAEAGVDLVFVPSENEMYVSPKCYVDIDSLGDYLCGQFREGHFRGVCTVVSKFFNIVQPDFAIFGQKDIQQALILQKMVSDLNFPLQLIIARTLREDDGLAMSSRNVRLNSAERSNSVAIYKSLQSAEQLILEGNTSARKILSDMENILNDGKPARIEYISLVDFDTLQPADKINKKCVIAIAAYFGATRLIDNMIIDPTQEKNKCIY